MNNVALLLIGALLTAVGAPTFLKQRRLHRRGSRTTGRVVDYRYEQGDSAALAPGNSDMMPQNSTQAHYYPVLEFATTAGQMVRTVSRVGSIVQPVLTEEQVRILYDPADPRLAEIDESMVRTAWWPALVGLLGVLIILVGLLGVIAMIAHK